MHTTKPNILYVDDEPVNLDMFKIIFRNNFKVFTAESGIEALEVIKGKSDIELVLCDMKMPKMNGLEFVENLRKIKSKLPCIIISGYSKTREIDEAIKNKFIAEYVTKPYKKEELEQHIIEVINTK